MNQQSSTPMTDALEPVVQRLEAQLPATRRALAYERRQHGCCCGMTVNETMEEK